MKNRAAFSGSWYSSDSKTLRERFDILLKSVPEDATVELPLRAAILPHAGLDFSGPGMAPAFRLVTGDRSISRVVILAPSHYVGLPPDSLAVEEFSLHQTPLGDLPGDPRFASACIAGAADGTTPFPGIRVECRNEAIGQEHAIEMFLPFLRYALPPAGRTTAGRTKEIPVHAVLVGEPTGLTQARRMGGGLLRVLETLDGLAAADSTLFIASSDFTHYGARFRHEPFGLSHGEGSGTRVDALVRERDGIFAELAAQVDLAGFFSAIGRYNPTICGRNAIMVLLAIQEIRRRRGRFVRYSNSNENRAMRPSDSFVGYATVLYGEERLK